MSDNTNWEKQLIPYKLTVMNNFKRLQEEELNRIPDLSDTQRSVHNQVEGMRTIGEVVELYLAKVLDVFVVMTGGKVTKNSSKRRSADQGYPTNSRSDAPTNGPSAG